MANVAPASPGKLKESVQAKTASSPKPVAQPRPAPPAAVAAPRPTTASPPAAAPRPATASRPTTAPPPVSAPRPATATRPAAPIKPKIDGPPNPPAVSKSVATSADERASALAFLAELATEVSKGTVNLPCFPDVVMRIRKALAAPDVSTTE